MLNRLLQKAPSNSSLLFSVSYDFSLTRSLLHYIRTLMNRVRWQQNRQFTAIQSRSNQVPKSYEQANKLFISTEHEISLDQKARMQRIDEILGTQTYYQQVKPYQERLDSDHVINLEELWKNLKEKNRKELDWQNPKSDIRIKYKNKKKYYAFVSKLRTYPNHTGFDYDFSDEKNENTIKFLGNEAVYSTISLKPIQIVATSIDNQPVGEQDRPFTSKKYSYFRPTFTNTFLRIEKTLFKDQMITSQKALQEASQYFQQVISIQQIYEIMKDYDMDERVSQYLKKIQNDRLDYYFSQFVYDQTQNIIAIVIDLIGTKKQFCLIVKNLSSGPEVKPRVFFNIKPGIVFSPDSKWISFVQRSQEGGWIELVYRPVQTCWSREGEVINQNNDQGQIIYRCSPQKQMKIATDSNHNYVFLILKDVGREYTQQLLLVDQPKDGQLKLIQIDTFPEGCKYYFDLCSQGVIFSRLQNAHNSHLKYGTNTSLSHSIQLIPFKSHIQIQQKTEQIGLSGLLTGSSSVKSSFPPPSQLDVLNKKTIYSSDEGQFIKQIQARQSHLVLILNIQSTYDRSILYFLPFKASAHPHSLILSGGSNLTLQSNNYLYQSQSVDFYKPNGGLFSSLKRYNIWKKQLIDVDLDWSRYHSQKIIIRQQSQSPLQFNIIVRSIYASEKNLPVLIYFPSKGGSMQSTVLRKYLQKGVMIVEFRGRGTFSKDLEHFLKGSRGNISNMLDDLQQLIEFIGNNMTKNISLYCKGQISSLVGLWFNIYFPYLFNATVLHNGIYDLKDEQQMKKIDEFMGPNEGQAKLNWEWFNPLIHEFKQAVRVNYENKKTRIGTLQNIIVSSDSLHRIHSRKLINRLRSNSFFHYEQVYLKQYENQYQTDLFNLAYIYSKMREKMEQDINSPQQEQEIEEEPKINQKTK